MLLSQGHTARKQPSRDLNPGLFCSKAYATLFLKSQQPPDYLERHRVLLYSYTFSKVELVPNCGESVGSFR